MQVLDSVSAREKRERGGGGKVYKKIWSSKTTFHYFHLPLCLESKGTNELS